MNSTTGAVAHCLFQKGVTGPTCPGQLFSHLDWGLLSSHVRGLMTGVFFACAGLAARLAGGSRATLGSCVMPAKHQHALAVNKQLTAECADAWILDKHVPTNQPMPKHSMQATSNALTNWIEPNAGSPPGLLLVLTASMAALHPAPALA